MKNILFATTALVATASIAAADVSISGSAEMGLVDTNAANQGFEFHQVIEVTFGMTGETDSGMTFGATVQLDEASASTANDDAGATVFVSSDFGTVTMGDTDGAFDWALAETGMGGTLNDNHTTHAGYQGNSGYDASTAAGGDGQVLRYDYSVNGFGVAVSLEQDTNNSTATGDNITGFGVTYAMDMGGTAITLGAGTQSAGANQDVSGASVKAVMANGITLVANMSDKSNTATESVESTGLGIGYTMDALTLTANWGENTTKTTGSADVKADGYAVVANYDLGGGAAAQFGYASSNTGASGAKDLNTVSVGLALSF